VVVGLVVVVDDVDVPEADSAVVIDQDAISMLFEWQLNVQEANNHVNSSISRVQKTSD